MPDRIPFGRNRRQCGDIRIEFRAFFSVCILTSLILAFVLMCCPRAVAEDPIRTSSKPAALTPDVDKVLKQSAVTRHDDSDRIAYLITQLDSLSYLARESAATELAGIGGLAIGPLAYQSMQCSPEQSWRIKKTLEQICTSGDEEVFFKAFGILQLRFDGGTVASSQKMIELQNKWKLKRMQEVITKLRKKGAEVTDPWGNANQAQNLQLGQFGGNVVFLNGRPIDFFDGSEQVVSTAKGRTNVKTLSHKELKSRIDKILDSDLEETRELVLDDADPSSVDVTAADQVANDIIVNQAIFARAGFPRSYARGVSVNLTKQWTGNEKDLESLKAVSNLTEVSIRDLELSPNAINSIARLPTMTKMVFDGGRLDPEDWDGSKWSRSLRELEFANREITTDLIEHCASIQSLQKLTFDQCEIQNAILDELKILKGLRGLEFKKTEINESIFDAIAGIKQLTSVNLSACKFKTKDYDKFKFRRPGLQVSFTAQAFLGVRGPVDVIQLAGAEERGSPGCLISEVISGSGADKAGMKVGDVIESVNRQPIVKFEDLRLHIAQHLPGDKLDINVQRSGATVELVVELGDIKSVPQN